MSGINSVVSSMVTILKNLEVQDPQASELFTVGDKLQAQVIAKEGESFLLQTAERFFRAQSDLQLNVGDKLFLLVTEQQDGRTILKLQVPAGDDRSMEQAQSKGQVQKDGEILNLTLPKTETGASIKEGQYLQGQVKAAVGDLLLVSTKDGAFTVKPAVPLPAGTEVLILVLNNPGDKGEAELQLWQVKPEMTNKGDLQTTNTPAPSNQAVSPQTANTQGLGIQNTNIQPPNTQSLNTQAANIQNLNNQRGNPQMVNTQQTNTQGVYYQDTNYQATNIQLSNPQANDLQEIITSSQPMMAKMMMENGSEFLPGSILMATVKDKADQHYLIEIGDKKYFLESDTELPVGGKLQLMAKETVGNKVSLQKYQPQQGKHDQPIDKIRALVAKYGLQGEKEVSQLAERLAQLPVDPQTGVRYLLDPHLATAVIIPPTQQELENTKIEIKEYKDSQSGQRVWEVSFDVNLAILGSIEVVLKLIDSKIYTRIWAEEPSTEALLREKQKEMEGLSTMLEIVSATMGPLIPREPAENIDLKV